MKSFGQWFAEQSMPAVLPDPELALADQLEALGFDLHKDGSVWCECCVCGGRIQLTDFLTTEEILRDADSKDQYCGKDERCCP